MSPGKHVLGWEIPTLSELWWWFHYYIVKYGVKCVRIRDPRIGCRSSTRQDLLSFSHFGSLLRTSSCWEDTQIQDFGRHYCWEWLGLGARYPHLHISSLPRPQQGNNCPVTPNLPTEEWEKNRGTPLAFISCYKFLSSRHLPWLGDAASCDLSQSGFLATSTTLPSQIFPTWKGKWSCDA